MSPPVCAECGTLMRRVDWGDGDFWWECPNRAQHPRVVTLLPATGHLDESEATVSPA